MSSEIITSCINIMRRMPPRNVENDVIGLTNLVPEYAEEILQRIDQPLGEATDPSNGRVYLLCDYNRDGDMYRSPWSNQYFPSSEDLDVFYPSAGLRELEVYANEVFDVYRELYYQGGYSSVYFWDLDQNDFAGCYLIKKQINQTALLQEGSWNSIHIIETQSLPGENIKYRLTTTIMLYMKMNQEYMKNSSVNVDGTITRQSERIINLNEKMKGEKIEFFHLENIGKQIEDMENDMRSSLDNLYISKTREIMNNLRSMKDLYDQKLQSTTPWKNKQNTHENRFVGELANAVKEKRRN